MQDNQYMTIRSSSKQLIPNCWPKCIANKYFHSSSSAIMVSVTFSTLYSMVVGRPLRRGRQGVPSGSLYIIKEHCSGSLYIIKKPKQKYIMC